MVVSRPGWPRRAAQHRLEGQQELAGERILPEDRRQVAEIAAGSGAGAPDWLVPGCGHAGSL